MFTAKEALAEGLIDRVGYPDEAIAWAKEMAGLDRIKVVIYHRPMGYKPNIYSSAASQIKPGALVNIEIPTWLKAEGPQFLYLWQPMLED